MSHNFTELPFKHVRIGGKKWVVQASLDLDDDALGATKIAQCIIQYNPTLSPDRLRDVIWHEIKHACFYESGMEQVFAEKEVDATEEMYVRALTPVELAVLRENPKLVEFLTEK